MVTPSSAQCLLSSVLCHTRIELGTAQSVQSKHLTPVLFLRSHLCTIIAPLANYVASQLFLAKIPSVKAP